MKIPVPRIPRLSSDFYLFLIVLNALGLIGTPIKIFYYHEGVEQWTLIMWFVNALFEVYWCHCWKETK